MKLPAAIFRGSVNKGHTERQQKDFCFAADYTQNYKDFGLLSTSRESSLKQAKTLKNTLKF